MFIVRNIIRMWSQKGREDITNQSVVREKLLVFFNDPKEINVILEMQYLPEEYRARRILSSKTSHFTTISTTNR